MNQVEFWFIKIPVQNWALVVDHRRQDLLSNLISEPIRGEKILMLRGDRISEFQIQGIVAGRRLPSSVIGIILVQFYTHRSRLKDNRLDLVMVRTTYMELNVRTHSS
jgi:hypothetical protein